MLMQYTIFLTHSDPPWSCWLQIWLVEIHQKKKKMFIKYPTFVWRRLQPFLLWEFFTLHHWSMLHDSLPGLWQNQIFDKIFFSTLNVSSCNVVKYCSIIELLHCYLFMHKKDLLMSQIYCINQFMAASSELNEAAWCSSWIYLSELQRLTNDLVSWFYKPISWLI